MIETDNKKKIIGIDGHMLGDHSGGNESYYSNILKNMKISKNMVVYLIVNKGIDITPYKDKFKIIYFREKNAFKRNFIELNKICKKYNFDVLHTQYFIPFRRSCKVVCTIHDICFEHYKDIFTKKEYIRQKILIPYAAKHSDYIFTVSEHAKKDIIAHYKIDPEKVIVTYNAVNELFRCIEKVDFNEQKIREKFEIGNGRILLTVGNLQPRKNLTRLIKAFNEYKNEKNDDLKLVIVGKKAWMYQGILSEILKNQKDIVLTDYVELDDLVYLYNVANAFIYPSFFEGFGIPPLEAMACGTPIGVSNTTSLPEVAGEAAVYFNPFSIKQIKEAINTLLNDKQLTEKNISLGYKQVKKFSWEKSAETITDIYLKEK